ncbi:MAG: hypothetical protein LIP28_08150 [Deltaproteobacteria bacterium]|nr:hypothetical protein [Deltaproteobacteria bacterium]
MGRIKVVSGDIPAGTEFYNNPGSIGGLPVASVVEADPRSVKEAGFGASFGIGRKICFIATFDDGRRALAITDPQTFGSLSRDIAGGPVSAESVAERKRENTRTGVLFLVSYAVSFIVLERYLAGYLPYLAALGVAVLAGATGKRLFSKSGR